MAPSTSVTRKTLLFRLPTAAREPDLSLEKYSTPVLRFVSLTHAGLPSHATKAPFVTVVIHFPNATGAHRRRMGCKPSPPFHPFAESISPAYAFRNTTLIQRLCVCLLLTKRRLFNFPPVFRLPAITTGCGPCTITPCSSRDGPLCSLPAACPSPSYVPARKSISIKDSLISPYLRGWISASDKKVLAGS